MDAGLEGGGIGLIAPEANRFQDGIGCRGQGTRVLVGLRVRLVDGADRICFQVHIAGGGHGRRTRRSAIWSKTWNGGSGRSGCARRKAGESLRGGSCSGGRSRTSGGGWLIAVIENTSKG